MCAKIGAEKVFVEAIERLVDKDIKALGYNARDCFEIHFDKLKHMNKMDINF